MTLDEAIAMGPESLLTPTEAAEILRMSPRSMERWRSEGNGPKTTPVGRRKLMYKVRDVARFAGADADQLYMTALLREELRRREASNG